MSGRVKWVLAGAVVVAVIVAGALGLGGRAEPKAEPSVATEAFPLQRGDLAVTQELAGTVGYAPGVPLLTAASGTVTWLPRQGKVVRLGEALMRVNDRPVTLMHGDIPMYRRLGLVAAEPAEPSTPPSAGTAGKGGAAPAAAPRPAPPRTMSGRDVAQFERNLRELGYTGFTVDDTFTSGTAAAVRRWQRSLGLEQTGAVEAGDISFQPKPVRISKVSGRVGAPVGEGTIAITTLNPVVTGQAAADDQAWAAGATVTVVDAEGKRHPGRVRSVRPTESAGSTAGNDVVVSVDAGAPWEPGTPVTVERVTAQRAGVFSVPVTALVALAEGGYGVDTGDGKKPSYVAVKPGLFADGKVEISGGGLRDGLEVRVPR